MRAFADQNHLLDDYRAVVQAVNDAANSGEGPRLFPGSPKFLAQMLRPQDFLILNKKHPEDAYALRGVMCGTSATVHERGDYELWLAMVPPRPAVAWW